MPTSYKLQEVRIICFTHWCIPSAQNNLSFSTHLFKLCIYNNTFWVDILFNEKGKTLVFWKNFEFLIYLLVFIRNQVLFLFFFFYILAKLGGTMYFQGFLTDWVNLSPQVPPSCYVWFFKYLETWHFTSIFVLSYKSKEKKIRCLETFTIARIDRTICL